MFDRKALSIKPLSQRRHDINISAVSSLGATAEIKIDEKIRRVAGHISVAKDNNGANLLIIGGHVIRFGVQHYLID